MTMHNSDHWNSNLQWVKKELRHCSKIFNFQAFWALLGEWSKLFIYMQTCQLSRFCCESHDFVSFLTVSRQGSSVSQVLGKIILKWFKLLNQNKNGKLTRNAGAIKWKTNKEEHCSYFFRPNCDFRFCSINWIIFLRVCPPFWKGTRPSGNEV